MTGAMPSLGEADWGGVRGLWRARATNSKRRICVEYDKLQCDDCSAERARESICLARALRLRLRVTATHGPRRYTSPIMIVRLYKTCHVIHAGGCIESAPFDRGALVLMKPSVFSLEVGVV